MNVKEILNEKGEDALAQITANIVKRNQKYLELLLCCDFKELEEEMPPEWQPCGADIFALLINILKRLEHLKMLEEKS